MNCKVVLITGSSQGIGKATAEHFLRAGYQVVVNSRSIEKVRAAREQLSRYGTVFGCAADVVSVADCKMLVESTVQRFGRLDVLVNNAGLSMQGALRELNPEVFRRVVEVNLIGAANMSNAALAEIRRRQGQILFVSSLAGLFGLPHYSAYSASKMALTALAQSLRSELYSDNVNVGVAYVGFTKNDPAKTILNAHGEMVPQPDRSFVRAATVDQTANAILTMAKYRQQKIFVGSPGRIGAWFAQRMPGLSQWYIRRMFRRHVLKTSDCGGTPIGSNVGSERGVGSAATT